MLNFQSLITINTLFCFNPQFAHNIEHVFFVCEYNDGLNIFNTRKLIFIKKSLQKGLISTT